MRKPRITVIGGGTGISVILNSLRKKDVEITAIVTVADDLAENWPVNASHRDKNRRKETVNRS